MTAKASFGICCIVLSGFCDPALAGLEVRQLSRPFALGDSRGVRIEVPYGHLTTETWEDDTVAIELALECSGEVGPCRDAARTVALSSERVGESLVVQVTGPWTAEDVDRSKAKILEARGWHLGAEIRVFYPSSLHLQVRLGKGVAEVRGLASDGRIEIGRGSATVTMKRADAGSMKLRCDRGEALIRRAGEQPLRGKQVLEWHEGDGECDLEVELGEGAIVVDLI